MAAHQADARRLLDDRGYSGPLLHNTNPAYLLEAPVRERIIDSYFWKEQCFGLNEATLCDRAVDMTCIGSTYGQQKPTPFLCLVLKMLQLLPSKDIIREYLLQKEFKYLTALASFYIRLAWEPKEVYETLEPLLGDYRKIRRRTREGQFTLTYLDQFVDDLLTKDRVCGTTFRKLPSRAVLEDLGVLEVRVSPLGDEVDELDDEDDDTRSRRSDSGRSTRSRRSRSRTRGGSYNQSRSRSRSRDSRYTRGSGSRTRSRSTGSRRSKNSTRSPERNGDKSAGGD
jgi:pre-mRNA-splicing factor 38A